MRGFQSSSFDKRGTGLAAVKATGIKVKKLLGAGTKEPNFNKRGCREFQKKMRIMVWMAVTGDLLGWSSNV